MKKSLMSFEKCSDANLIPYFSWPYVGRNDRYEVGVRDKKHENSLPLDLHGVKFERISRIFDPTF